MILEEWRQPNGKYKCPTCGKEFAKKGISTHLKFGHGKDNRKKISNFIAYNKHLKEGLVTKDFTNQYDKANKLGLKKPEFSEKAKLSFGRNKGKTLEEILGDKKAKEVKEKLSKIRSERILELGVGGFKNLKIFEVQNLDGEKFKLRGTWEFRLSQWLNGLGIRWKGRNMLLVNMPNGITKRYLPDFYLPDLNIFLEPKGWENDENLFKIKLAGEQHDAKIYLIKDKQIKNLDKFKTIEDLLNY